MSAAPAPAAAPQSPAPPAKPGTMQEHALEWLRRAIVSGELRPGGKVRQDEIAERIGASVVPVREALRVLEQEGQLTYLARRGYFVSDLRAADLEEIYSLREVLEARAARRALPSLDAADLDRIERAAEECTAAAANGDVAAALDANRRFHFAILAAPDQPHTLRVIRQLWDSTEAYRALYYNSAAERAATAAAHARILAAVRDHDADRLVSELDAHRIAALEALRPILAGAQAAETVASAASGSTDSRP